MKKSANKNRFLILLCLSISHLYAQTGIGYDLLHKEKTAQLASDNRSVQILDSLVNACAASIQTKNTSPAVILKQIGNTLYDSGFRYHENNFSYAQALKSRQFDCDQFTITYSTIARKMGLPVYAILLPQHMAILWEDTSSKLYWETTINKEKTVFDYEKDYNLSPQAMKNDAVMHKVLAKEEPALAAIYLGEFFLSKKEYDKARPYLETAQIMLPTNTAVKNNLGVMLQNKDKPEKAMRLFKECMALDPHDVVAYNNAGLYYYQQNNFDSAVYYYNTSLSYKNDFADAYNNRGLAFGHMGKYEQAISDFDKALSINSTDAEYHMNKGVCLLYLKKFEEAVQSFDTSLNLNPENPDALVNKAVAKTRLGAIDEACQCLREAIKMGSAAAVSYSKRICP